jgi:hypothetical protein
LKFRYYLDTGRHTSYHQILPKGVINLEGKKILVRPSQAETTKGENVIIGESREKVRPTTKKSKPTFDEHSANIRKAMLTPKVDKTGLSKRSNRSFQFPHVRPMFQLLADAKIQRR